DIPGVTGVAPFTINPMMVTRGDRTATGVLLKGVDPARVNDVLDLPKHIVEGNLDGLRLPGARHPLSRRETSSGPTYPKTGSDLVITGDPPPKDDSTREDDVDPFDRIDDLIRDEDSPEEVEIDPSVGIADLLADIEKEKFPEEAMGLGG